MKRNSRIQLIDPFENIRYGDVSQEELTHFVGEYSAPVFVDCIGISHPNPKYHIERKKSEYYVLEYVLSGVGHIVCNDKTYIVKKDDLYILEEGSGHSYWADKDDPYEKIWINIHSSIIKDVLNAYGLSGKTVFKNSNCKSLFNELLQLSKTTIFNEEICYDAAVIVFKILSRLAQNEQNVQYASTIAKYTKIFLDENVYGNITVDAIAKNLLVSKAQVISEFKKYYGSTPYAYYIEKKIEAAKQILETTSSRIGEISEVLGFGEQNYFSNLFKKKIGISPEAYRKKYGTPPIDVYYYSLCIHTKRAFPQASCEKALLYIVLFKYKFYFGLLFNVMDNLYNQCLRVAR